MNHRIIKPASMLSRIDFGNEAGDDVVDLEELASYFVEQSSFHKFLDNKHKLLIATAKKGVGKSALIQWTAYKIGQADPDAIVIKCRGADLARGNFHLSSELTTPNEHIRDWMVRLCALVNRELALRCKLALTDDQITLVESAELDGYKSRNLISCLLDRFQKIFDKGHPSKIHASDEIALLKRVNNRKVWILVDDLDATFQKTSPESVDLSTFFSACRYLTQDVKDVHFRVTVRTDVWSVIRRFDEALDKVEQYVHDIRWSQAEFRQLLYKRIHSEMIRLGAQLPVYSEHMREDEIEELFIRSIFVPKLDWGDKPTQTYKVIYTLSYERPRWAIQLCKLAQISALERGDDLINQTHINNVWGDYGNKRIDDLESEHKHQCQDVNELLNGFRGAERLMNRDTLINWINKHIMSHMSAVIEGKAVTSPLEIAHFLYRIGFLIARADDPKGGYEHFYYSQMPDFLSSRTNNDFNVSWEIHPCYREALDIKKLTQANKEKFIKLRGGNQG